MIKQVSHIGIAVKDINKVREFYSTMLNVTCSPPTEHNGLKISMVHTGDAILELLEPLSNESAIGKFLEKHGEGVHHICLEVDDIETELEMLTRKGVELIDKKPRPGAEGMIAFLHPKMSHGVLIELVQKPGAANK